MGGSAPAENEIIAPASWEEIVRTLPRGLLMIAGGADSGKSALARWLFLRLAATLTGPLAFLDGDPGQSALGPPTTITLAVAQPGLIHFPGRGRRWRRFIGSTTPRYHMLPLLTGIARLIAEARSSRITTIVHDTTGLIDPAQGGVALKLAKIDLLRPEALIAIQQRDELEPLLSPLRRSMRTRVLEVAPSPQARRRGAISRRRYRAARFAEYFAGARWQELDLTRFAVIPQSRPVGNQLLAFENAGGFVLALGIAMALDEGDNVAQILTPIRHLSSVDTIRLADLAVDPGSFCDRQIQVRPLI